MSVIGQFTPRWYYKCPFTLQWWGQIPMENHCNWLYTKLLLCMVTSGSMRVISIILSTAQENFPTTGRVDPYSLQSFGSRKKTGTIQSKDSVKCWSGLLIGWSWRGVDDNKVGMLNLKVPIAETKRECSSLLLHTYGAQVFSTQQNEKKGVVSDLCIWFLSLYLSTHFSDGSIKSTTTKSNSRRGVDVCNLNVPKVRKDREQPFRP